MPFDNSVSSLPEGDNRYTETGLVSHSRLALICEICCQLWAYMIITEVSLGGDDQVIWALESLEVPPSQVGLDFAGRGVYTTAGRQLDKSGVKRTMPFLQSATSRFPSSSKVRPFGSPS